MEFKGTKGDWVANYSHELETYIKCNGLRVADVNTIKVMISTIHQPKRAEQTLN